MYSRDNVRDLIRLVEVGLLRLGDGTGHVNISKFALEDWKNAFDAAAAYSGSDKNAVIVP